RALQPEGKVVRVSPLCLYPTHMPMLSKPDSTSSLVMARLDMPFVEAAYLSATASNHPHLLGLPVVEPYSPPASLSRLPASPWISDGNGPSPTLVAYALATPRTTSILVGLTPVPVHAPPELALDEVT